VRLNLPQERQPSTSRSSLWHLCRKRAQVVSRSAQLSGRLDCCRIRRGRGSHREMILGYGYEAAFLWVVLGQGLVIVLLSRLLRAAAGRNAEASDSADAFATRSRASRSTTLTGVLGALFYVRDGSGIRLNGDRTACADCDRLWLGRATGEYPARDRHHPQCRARH
jgi:hypothetical protein